MKNIIDLYEASILDIEGTIKYADKFVDVNFMSILKAESEEEFLKMYNTLKNMITKDNRFRVEVGKNFTSSSGKIKPDKDKRWIRFSEFGHVNIQYGGPSKTYTIFWDDYTKCVINKYSVFATPFKKVNINNSVMYELPSELYKSCNDAMKIASK